MPKVILLANRLPVKLAEDGSFVPSGGGLASAVRGLDGTHDIQWVGWPGLYVHSETERDELCTKLAANNTVPVFLDEDQINGFYNGYANGTLWPLFHYMSTHAEFDQHWYGVYHEVNQLYADAAIETAGDNDLIWIHDYQLMLVPQMIREKRPDLRIGFFLHIPFPSYELFRIVPERRQLIEGLLGADLIGFHTYGYLRHFRSTLLRICDLESAPGGVDYRGRDVQFGVYPIGHNAKGFDEAMSSQVFDDQLQKLKEEFKGQRMILSVERLDYTKGIPQKIAAIRHFLETRQDLLEEVVFLILAVPSRQDVEKYRELTEEVQLAISEINGKYSTFSHQPIHFYHRGTDLPRLAALYAYAEIAMVTPLIDGMNLVAKEYIHCQMHKEADPGVLILSEFAGSANELSGAIMINPYDVREVSQALVDALEVPADEREHEMRKMSRFLLKRDAQAWANNFVNDMQRERQVQADSLVAPGPEFFKEFAAAKRLAIFLDYDGTLREFTSKPNAAVPSGETLDLLEQLAGIEKVDLSIVSGRPEEFLQTHLGHLPVTLIAEHGYRWRIHENGETRDWELFNPMAETTWKEQLMPMLEHVSALTPGTEVEEKKSALVWHYRRADPEFGQWKALELIGELTEAAANLPVEVHHGNKIVEVVSHQVSKGRAVEALMLKWTPDLGLCVGDDRTDEAMFRVARSMPNFHSIKVGEGETEAQYRIPHTDAVREFLKTLLATLTQPDS